MSDHTDVKLKTWGNGSNSGPWVKFDLQDDAALEAFKTEVGSTYHMFLVRFDSEEKPGQVYETVGEVKPKGKKPKTLSNEAFFLVNSENFKNFLQETFCGNFSTFQCRDMWLKKTLEIDSKKELDGNNVAAIKTFNTLRDNFRKWVNA